MNHIREIWVSGIILGIIILAGLMSPTAAAPVANYTTVPGTGLAPLNVSFIDQSVGEGLSYRWNISNASGLIFSSQERNPYLTLQYPGTYYANLTVTDKTSLKASDNNTIIVGDSRYPSLGFAAVPENGTAPLHVSFVDQSVLDPDIIATQGPADYYWTFDGKNVSREKNPEYTFTAVGNHTVKMNFTYGGFKSGVVTKNITVLPPDSPVANFTVIPSTGLAPLNVSIVDQSSGSSELSYDWKVGNATKVLKRFSEKNPQFQLTSPGTYFVNLTVTDAYGLSASDNYTNLVVGKVRYPNAAFTAVPDNGTVPLHVSFVDQSVLDPDVSATAGKASYYWTFDGKNESFDQNPDFTYTQPGVYEVKMNLTHNGVNSGVATKNITVYPYEMPNAVIAAAPMNGSVPLRVSFVDESCKGSCKSDYLWDFGDNQTSTSRSPIHVYKEAGSYPVKLTITSPYGVTSKTELSEKIFVYNESSTDLPLEANFTATSTEKVAPFTVQFKDLSNGVPATWEWYFGDGTNTSEKSPQHVYQDPGVYNVSLNVSDQSGNSSSSSKIGFITAMSPAIQADFVYSSRNDSTIQFTDTSKGVGIDTWYWDFGDNTNTTVKSPVHTYPSSGVFTVKHQAKSAVTSDEMTYSLLV